MVLGWSLKQAMEHTNKSINKEFCFVVLSYSRPLGVDKPEGVDSNGACSGSTADALKEAG